VDLPFADSAMGCSSLKVSVQSSRNAGAGLTGAGLARVRPALPLFGEDTPHFLESADSHNSFTRRD
jgi:hypothetical protein